LSSEARALEILSAWIEQGYSVRLVLTSALIALDHPGSEPTKSEDSRGIERVLDKIGLLLEILKAKEPDPGIREDPEKELFALQDNFLASITQAVKPGIKVG
jgi:hypothetical protein